MSQYALSSLAVIPAGMPADVARVLVELAENDFLYWQAERERADAAQRALDTGATWEQVAEVMQLETTDIRALVA